MADSVKKDENNEKNQLKSNKCQYFLHNLSQNPTSSYHLCSINNQLIVHDNASNDNLRVSKIDLQVKKNQDNQDIFDISLICNKVIDDNKEIVVPCGDCNAEDVKILIEDVVNKQYNSSVFINGREVYKPKEIKSELPNQNITKPKIDKEKDLTLDLKPNVEPKALEVAKDIEKKDTETIATTKPKPTDDGTTEQNISHQNNVEEIEKKESTPVEKPVNNDKQNADVALNKKDKPKKEEKKKEAPKKEKKAGSGLWSNHLKKITKLAIKAGTVFLIIAALLGLFLPPLMGFIVVGSLVLNTLTDKILDQIEKGIKKVQENKKLKLFFGTIKNEKELLKIKLRLKKDKRKRRRLRKKKALYSKTQENNTQQTVKKEDKGVTMSM